MSTKKQNQAEAIQAVAEQLEAKGFILTQAKSGRHDGKLWRRFDIVSIESVSVQGSDGEYNNHALFGTRVAIPAGTLLTMEEVVRQIEARSYGKTFDQIVSEVAEETAKIRAERAERMAAYQAKRAEEEAALNEAMKPADADEVVSRLKDILTRQKADNEKKLEWFRRENTGCLMDDHYRTEFLSLVSDSQVLALVCELASRKTPAAFFTDQHSAMLKINREANVRKIPHRSLGGVPAAVKYLIGA